MNLLNPTVSVVIPAFNAEKTIVDTLISCCQQTYTDIEVIVVDDGSTDSTKEIVEGMSKEDSRIRCFSTRNCGVGAARNYGVSVSVGDFIAPLDADDIWHETKIQHQVMALVNLDCAYGLVYSPCRAIDGEGSVVKSLPLYGVDGWCTRQLAYYNFTQNGSSILVKNAVFEAVGGYPEGRETDSHADLLFVHRVSRMFKIKCVEKYNVGYRQRTTSLSQNYESMYRSAIASMNILNLEGSVSSTILSWNVNRSRLRYIYHLLKSQGFSVNLLRLYSSAISHDFVGTTYFTYRGLRHEITRNFRTGGSVKFIDYSLSDSGNAHMPLYMKFRLYRLRKLDELSA